MATGTIFERIEAIQRELAELQRELAPLMNVFAGERPSRGARPRQRAGRRPGGAARKPSRRAGGKSSPAIARLRKLQGTYMGIVRHLSAAQKAAVKKIRETKGLPAAIAAAKKAAK